MFTEERLNQILELLEHEGRVQVKDLSKKFNISEPMIRKDLQRLEKEGKLKRTYGGAILERRKAESTSIETRLIKNSQIKSLIAERAFQELADGDLIFLDISSINYLLAKLVSERNKKVTIVTNMIEIPSLFGSDSDTEIICIGGNYNKKLGGVIGSAAIDNILRYRVDKAFIGSCGINVYQGTISNFDLEEAYTKKAIINCSKTVYVVMENEKFNFDGPYNFASLDDINYIITESGDIGTLFPSHQFS
ncbi:DeoR/GlpR family DNA-binding transcription regulator [Clostridium thermarum]|uniref:DeoR/GlpR family DNA-binding transcription regulator n=1 Tax=Clostridium thermarum TaxID=1716543 RepID=UPI001122D92F|nr:DeoR/GlpR family DNA-binding transcription regulator [Clostridium thermarum]